MTSTILLVDGYKLTRHCLRQWISAQPQWQAVEASGVAEARRAVAAYPVALVLIDVSDPTRNGLETFCDLKVLLPEIPVLVVNGKAEDMQVGHYLRLGCVGYLTRQASITLVQEAIASALAGKAVGTDIPHVAADTSQSLSGHPNPGLTYRPLAEPSETQTDTCHRVAEEDALSFREMQIFLKLLRGQSTTGIARELGIAASSVSVFKTRLLQKLRVANQADLIAYALRRHLVRLPAGQRVGTSFH